MRVGAGGYGSRWAAVGSGRGGHPVRERMESILRSWEVFSGAKIMK